MAFITLKPLAQPNNRHLDTVYTSSSTFCIAHYGASSFPPRKTTNTSAIVTIMKHSDETIGIILINTGSPASPNPCDIRPYLIEFLSDKNIIPVPRPIWLPILHGIIARKHPKKTTPRYRQVWTPNGAPLLVEAFAQRDALNKRFAQEGLSFVAEVGMRYGSPSIEEAYSTLKQKGCTRFIGFPLFPQTATCTTGTCKEKFLQVVPDSEVAGFIEGYADNPLYWKSLANSISQYWSWKPGSKILFSLHSIPLSNVKAGDTYLEEAKESLAHTAELLGLSPDDWDIAYHSRFEDSRAWVTPSPETLLTVWAKQGTIRVALVTPGFAADCLESLYDIALVTKEHFERQCRECGTTADVTYIPALNHRDDHIDLLLDEIKQHF